MIFAPVHATIKNRQIHLWNGGRRRSEMKMCRRFMGGQAYGRGQKTYCILRPRSGRGVQVYRQIPDFATCSILTIEKNVENTAFGLYFFNFML